MTGVSEIMERRLWHSFDGVLLTTTLLAIALGTAMIYSATRVSSSLDTSLLDNLVIRQILYALAGLVLMFVIALVDYRFLENFQHPLYLAGVGLLAALVIAGRIAGGAQRWFLEGSIQPSELAKLVVIVTLAKYLADRGNDMRVHHVLFSAVYVALPMVLIYLQPDLGTALILGAIWLVMAFIGGVKWWQLALLGMGAILALPWAWLQLEDYMRDRILLFLNPDHDLLGAGYNINQARIAVGSGGLLGQGFASGTQSQLHFLRVRHTDFVFSVLAEELGFIGALLLFILLAVIILRILRVASLARGPFGRLIVCGVATVILVQSVVNIAVNMGLLPVTGMPLPFISYGGSSMVTLLMAQGLVQSVAMRHRRLDFY